MIFVLAIPMILGMCALVIDAGNLFAQKRSLQKAADAAALAATQELPVHAATGWVRTEPRHDVQHHTAQFASNFTKGNGENTSLLRAATRCRGWRRTVITCSTKRERLRPRRRELLPRARARAPVEGGDDVLRWHHRQEEMDRGRVRPRLQDQRRRRRHDHGNRRLDDRHRRHHDYHSRATTVIGGTTQTIDGTTTVVGGTTQTIPGSTTVVGGTTIGPQTTVTTVVTTEPAKSALLFAKSTDCDTPVVPLKIGGANSTFNGAVVSNGGVQVVSNNIRGDEMVWGHGQPAACVGTKPAEWQGIIRRGA